MGRLRHRVVLFIGILICSAGATTGMTESPVTASPGSATGFAAIADRCPTFSWGGVEGARAYELVVYKVGKESVDSSPTETRLEGLGVLHIALKQQLSGKVSSWTPPVAQCLSPGDRYAWSIRALHDAGESEWAETRLFTLSNVPSATDVQAALRLLQQYVEEGGTLEAIEPPAADREVSSNRRVQMAGDTGTKRPGTPAQTEGVSGAAAIRGNQPDLTGTTFGVVGESASPDGAAVGAANTAGGTDLLLDGTADGETDTLLTQNGINRPSAGAETFEIANSDGGTMTLFIGDNEAVTTATDSDTLAALTCGSGELAKRFGSSGWQCAIDTNTLYFPGFGLDLAATTFSIDPAEVQQRVTGVCPRGESIRVVDQAGTVACEVDDDTTYAFGSGLVLVDGVVTVDPGAFATRISTIASDAYNPSVAIGSDGLGLISYFRAFAGLQVAHCNNTACTVAATSTLDSGSVGLNSSIAIGGDGLGLISYFDGSTNDLKVAHCNDTACTSATTPTLDSGGTVGQYSSIAIGSDGLGLISYFDWTNRDLKVAHCDNTSCSSATTSTLDSTDNVGEYTSIAIGSDGLGLISYLDDTNDNLKVAHCSNTACTSATTTTVDSAGSVGHYNSITIGPYGLGLISYFDFTDFDLKVAHCTNTACTNAVISTLDEVGQVGRYTSITLGTDGLGLISYDDITNGALKVARCVDLLCTSAISSTLDVTSSLPGADTFTSIALGTDGLGLISYYDAIDNELKVVHLGIGVP